MFKGYDYLGIRPLLNFRGRGSNFFVDDRAEGSCVDDV